MQKNKTTGRSVAIAVMGGVYEKGEEYFPRYRFDVSPQSTRVGNKEYDFELSNQEYTPSVRGGIPTGILQEIYERYDKKEFSKPTKMHPVKQTVKNRQKRRNCTSFGELYSLGQSIQYNLFPEPDPF